MSRAWSYAGLTACVSTAAFVGSISACSTVYADPVTAPFSSSFGGFPDSGLTSQRMPPVVCPKTLSENSPCPRVGGVCELGSSPDSRCNTHFFCANDADYGAYWTEQTPGTCADVCPDPSQIADGAPCTLSSNEPDAELHCITPLGACICTTGRDGAHAHARTWVCTKPAEGCPSKRPLLGATCVGSLSCDYGSCASKRGSRMFCGDDVWQTEIGQCAD